ncbi:mitochondrial uncoupling protein [Musa troglodytarum]|uniref:Mitochondrial uncoupling protein n=1 Tax=Musa troglodytarum TaxID=320322 RepID=A0A9E7G964_9LILI|nr:mitochondrial uncoupling protein [Musa troglodytarum]
MADHGSRTDISFYWRFASSAIAACFAEFCTIPLDTAKVRLQLQKKAVAGDAVGVPKYRGMLGTILTIFREEGLTALWTGLVPGLHRQCLYGGLRIGLYEPVKAFFFGDSFVGDISLIKKILAGLITGALAITVANPTDLVKFAFNPSQTSTGCTKTLFRSIGCLFQNNQTGIGSLWTGLGPNIARNAIINAAELASYDHIKQTILEIPGFTDDIFTHVVAGLGAGFFAVCIGSPVDVDQDHSQLCSRHNRDTRVMFMPWSEAIGFYKQVKSRMMGDSSYKSTLDCFIKTLKNEGPLALYKGFIPNFVRLGSWNVIMFLTLEQVKMFFIREVPL